MTHADDHLNTAWNSRHESPDVVEETTAADFRKWRQFPRDLDGYLES